jgi:hypothetical protein
MFLIFFSGAHFSNFYVIEHYDNEEKLLDVLGQKKGTKATTLLFQSLPGSTGRHFFPFD